MTSSSPPRFDAHLVPQADDLDTIRAVLAVIAAGATTRSTVATGTRFPLRHANYRLRAALSLGLAVDGDDGLTLTPAGRKLLTLPPGCEAERSHWREAFRSAPALSDLAPDLFATAAPRRTDLARRIEHATQMARSTAHRRAGTLLSWRRRMLPRQLSLFGPLDAAAP